MKNIVVYIKVTSAATLLGLSSWYILADYSPNHTPLPPAPEVPVTEPIATTSPITTPVRVLDEPTVLDNQPLTTLPAMIIPETTPAPLPIPTPIPTPVLLTTPVVEPEPPEVRFFREDFTNTYTLHEAERLTASTHPDWWVSSGGYLFSENGIGSTIVGALKSTDERYKTYLSTNPTDTDGGQYPQNIFRLVQTGHWHDSVQEAKFRIVHTNYSSSLNRNASNGLLFFIHYQDEFNLYYAGIRVDGYAVIKKKVRDTYYTLALEPVFVDSNVYRRSAKQNFLPQNEWIALRSTVATDKAGAVTIQLYLDTAGTGQWQHLISATDTGEGFGGPVFTSGYAGIRTDFMDVNFDMYQISELE